MRPVRMTGYHVCAIFSGGGNMAVTSTEFPVALESVNGVLLARLPEALSAGLPSRGLVMGEGRLAGADFILPLEPDGRGGHFLVIDADLAARAGARADLTLPLRLRPAAAWPEPEVPEDLLQGLLQHGQMDAWAACTVKARWEWLRWLRATNSAATRAKRVEVACDKLSHGERRPCCFNASACTLMAVCRSGALSG